jgi:hypothetical protein
VTVLRKSAELAELTIERAESVLSEQTALATLLGCLLTTLGPGRG